MSTPLNPDISLRRTRIFCERHWRKYERRRRHAGKVTRHGRDAVDVDISGRPTTSDIAKTR